MALEDIKDNPFANAEKLNAPIPEKSVMKKRDQQDVLEEILAELKKIHLDNIKVELNNIHFDNVKANLDIVNSLSEIVGRTEELNETIKQLMEFVFEAQKTQVPTATAKVEATPKKETVQPKIEPLQADKPKVAESLVPEKWKSVLYETKDNQGIPVLRQSKRLDTEEWKRLAEDLKAKGWKWKSAGKESHFRRDGQ